MSSSSPSSHPTGSISSRRFHLHVLLFTFLPSHWFHLLPKVPSPCPPLHLPPIPLVPSPPEGSISMSSSSPSSHPAGSISSRRFHLPVLLFTFLPSHWFHLLPKERG